MSNDFVIENGVLKEYRGSATDVVIPDGVTEIGERAFWACKSLLMIHIPDSVRVIGNWAFNSASTIICAEGSCAHRYCLIKHVPFVFDYQHFAF